MSGFEGYRFIAENFSQKVRILQIPELTLYPHIIQPLHINKPLLCKLVELSLADDQLLAIPFDGSDHSSKFGPMACLCHIANANRLPDGSYNILLIGLRRVNLLCQHFRSHKDEPAEVEIVDDYCSSLTESVLLIEDLKELIQQILPSLPGIQEQLDPLLNKADISLGVLTDVLAFSLDLSPDEKGLLLSECNVIDRADRLLEILGQMAEDSCVFTKKRFWHADDFSLN
jgi:ATP-dependent Lon protease